MSRHDPRGKLEREIELPVQYPTSCAFGEALLDELYITSARTRCQRRADPRSTLRRRSLRPESGHQRSARAEVRRITTPLHATGRITRLLPSRIFPSKGATDSSVKPLHIPMGVRQLHCVPFGQSPQADARVRSGVRVPLGSPASANLGTGRRQFRWGEGARATIPAGRIGGSDPECRGRWELSTGGNSSR